MLIESLIWYTIFISDIEKQGFKFNPYNVFFANMQVIGKQHTVLFHVDDLASINVEKNLNDRFDEWLKTVYCGYGKVKYMREKAHNYPEMTFGFYEKDKVKIDMIDYMN